MISGLGTSETPARKRGESVQDERKRVKGVMREEVKEGVDRAVDAVCSSSLSGREFPMKDIKATIRAALRKELKNIDNLVIMIA